MHFFINEVYMNLFQFRRPAKGMIIFQTICFLELLENWAYSLSGDQNSFWREFGTDFWICLSLCVEMEDSFPSIFRCSCHSCVSSRCSELPTVEILQTLICHGIKIVEFSLVKRWPNVIVHRQYEFFIKLHSIWNSKERMVTCKQLWCEHLILTG